MSNEKKNFVSGTQFILVPMSESGGAMDHQRAVQALDLTNLKIDIQNIIKRLQEQKDLLVNMRYCIFAVLTQIAINCQ